MVIVAYDITRFQPTISAIIFKFTPFPEFLCVYLSTLTHFEPVATDISIDSKGIKQYNKVNRGRKPTTQKQRKQQGEQQCRTSPDTFCLK